MPAKSVQELVALAKSKPGELYYGSAGNGSAGSKAESSAAVSQAADVAFGRGWDLIKVYTMIGLPPDRPLVTDLVHDMLTPGGAIAVVNGDNCGLKARM